MINCPNCNTENIVKMGKFGKANKQRYGCKSCKYNGISPWTFYDNNDGLSEQADSQQNKQPNIISCPNPECNSTNVVKIGKPYGKQRYACTDCHDFGRNPWTFYESEPKEQDPHFFEALAAKPGIVVTLPDDDDDPNAWFTDPQIPDKKAEQTKVEKSKNKILRKKKIELLKKQNRLLEE